MQPITSKIVSRIKDTIYNSDSCMYSGISYLVISQLEFMTVAMQISIDAEIILNSSPLYET